MSGFQKATKKKAKARIALDGPSGAGKTWTGLTTAIALAGPNGRVAVIDSERGSASLYADRFDFDVLDLEDFNPRRYIRAIQDAADAGYDVLLIDSLTHAWQFVLEYVDQAKKRFGGNSYMAWSEGTPLWQALIDAILKAPMHVVVTMRSKSKFVEEQDNKGRTTYKRAGTEPVARDGVEFEFTIVGDMNLDHDLIISKTRCGDAVPVFYREPGPEFGRAVLAFLESGEDVPEPTRAERIKADPTCVVAMLREEYPEATDGMTDEDIKDRVRGRGTGPSPRSRMGRPASSPRSGRSLTPSLMRQPRSRCRKPLTLCERRRRHDHLRPDRRGACGPGERRRRSPQRGTGAPEHRP